LTVPRFSRYTRIIITNPFEFLWPLY